MPSLELRGAMLSYECRGEGVPVVFLHGLGSSGADWAFQLEHFGPRFRCIAVDLRGSGGSRDLERPWGPFTLAQLAGDVAAVLERLDARPAHVVGLSMGAMTGLQLALDEPAAVRSLVMVNALAAVRATTAREHALLGLRRVVTATLGPKGVARLVAPRLFPAAEHAALRQRFVSQVSAIDRRVYAAHSRAVLQWTVEERLPSLARPVLLVAAEHDYTPVAAKEALARRMPAASVEVIPRAHHAVPVEAPAAFNAVLERWLASQAT